MAKCRLLLMLNLPEWNNRNRSTPLFPNKFLEVKGQQSDLTGEGQRQGTEVY